MGNSTMYRYDVQDGFLRPGAGGCETPPAHCRATGPARRGLGQRPCAWWYSGARQPAEYDRRRAELLGGLTGDVLEIGPGPSGSLRYCSPGARWTGLEPNVFMHDRIRREAAERGIAASIV